MKSNRERKAKERQRKKELGLVRLECWCTPKNKKIIKAIAEDLEYGSDIIDIAMAIVELRSFKEWQ